MAESVSSCVKRIVDKSPFIGEMLTLGILSFSNYAALISDEVERALGKPAKSSAIVMALRRYGEDLKRSNLVRDTSNVNYQIVMKTNIFDINLVRRDSFIGKLGSLYNQISTEKGDFLNITLGSHEISLAVSEKYRPLIKELTKDEEVLNKEDDLVALSLVFTGDFLQTPGIVYEAVRHLAWQQINVIEIVSTMNELTFVISGRIRCAPSTSCRTSSVFNELTLIVSPIGGGKTRYLSNLNLPSPHCGVVTSSNIEKTIYHIKDLSSGEKRLLLSEEQTPNTRRFGRFFVLEETFDWANGQIISNLPTCSVAVFDEIGRIELEGWGLQPSFLKALQTPDIEIYATIRDTFLEQVIRAFDLEKRILEIIRL